MLQSATRAREIAFFALLFVDSLAELTIFIAKVAYITLAFAWLTLTLAAAALFASVRYAVRRCQQARWRFSLRTLLITTTMSALILGAIGTIIATAR